MELEPITISIKSKTTKKEKAKGKINLEGYIKIKPELLRYFYGTWIKCISPKEPMKSGFLNRIHIDIIYIKNTFESNELIEINKRDTSIKFYVKNDTQQYYAMQEIENEREYLHNKTKQLKKEKKEFEKSKKSFEKMQFKFYKAVSDGKISILV